MYRAVGLTSCQGIMVALFVASVGTCSVPRQYVPPDGGGPGGTGVAGIAGSGAVGGNAAVPGTPGGPGGTAVGSGGTADGTAGSYASTGGSTPGTGGASGTAGIVPRGGAGGSIASTGGISGTGGTTNAPGTGGAGIGVPLGTTCSSGTSCLSGYCVDGVCCDRACGGACEACNGTGIATPGTCAFVSGAPRSGHPGCTGSDACASSCKGHSASCVFPGTEAQCRNATCSGGTATSSAVCDGAGNCPTSSTRTCDPFICGPTACKTACAGSSDCTGTNYCDSSTCIAKKAAGSVCTSFEQCGTSICGGRCCATPCTCPQPSAQNLFKNAGFDSDLTSWGSFSSGSGVQWNSQDVDGCPFSGSVQVISALGNPSQCVAVTPGASYVLGGWFKNPDGALYYCSVASYSGPNCTGTADSTSSLNGTDTSWTFRTIPSFQIPANDVSLMFRCDSNPNTLIDKLSLSTTGNF